MANSTISLTVSLVMVALFSIAIIGFSISFAEDNSAAINIANDPNITSLRTNSENGLDTFKTDSESTYTSLVKSESEPGSDSIKSPGAFTITWSNVFGVTTNIANVGYQKVFGSGGNFAIFFTTILGVIGFMSALYIIKTWRGNP